MEVYRAGKSFLEEKRPRVTSRHRHHLLAVSEFDSLMLLLNKAIGGINEISSPMDYFSFTSSIYS